MHSLKKHKMEFEDMFQYIGHFGLYQLLIFVLVGFLGVFHGYEALGMIFLGLGQDHFCSIEELKEFPYEMQKYIAIPKFNDHYSQCQVFDLPWSSYNFSDFVNWNRSAILKNATTTTCGKLNYILSRSARTVQTEFDLVCGNGWYIQMASTCYLAGMMVGSFLSGILSDRFGRLRVLVGGTMLHPILGIAIAFCPNIQLFCFLRFLLGVAAFSAFISGFVYVSELFGPKYRTYGCLAYNSTYSMGNMLVAVEAYFVRDYTNLMLVMCLPVVVTSSYYWILPDSARWLNATGQKQEALDVIKLVADVNKRRLPDDVHLSDDTKTKEKGAMLDLFQPILRKTTLIMYFLWFTNSLLFYGIALNIGSLVGNVFLNAFLSSGVDVIAIMSSALLAEKVGRKPSLFITFLIGGVSNLAIIPLIVLNKGDWIHLILTVLGRSASCAAFSLSFLTTAELFPTQIRQMAMGSCSTVSRFSGVLAPYIGGPLAMVWKPLPSLIFGFFGVMSAFLTLFLRETLKQPMPDTVEDVDRLEKKKHMTYMGSEEHVGVKMLNIVL